MSVWERAQIDLFVKGEAPSWKTWKGTDEHFVHSIQ